MSSEIIIEAEIFSEESRKFGTVANDYGSVQGTYTSIGEDVWGTLSELNQFGPETKSVQTQLASKLLSISTDIDQILTALAESARDFDDTQSDSAVNVNSVATELGQIQSELGEVSANLGEYVGSLEQSATSADQAYQEDQAPAPDYSLPDTPPQDSPYVSGAAPDNSPVSPSDASGAAPTNGSGLTPDAP